MTATPSQRLRLQLQQYLDNPDAWGDVANEVFKRIEEAIAGVEEITVNGNVTLNVQNYAEDQSRNFALRFVGAGGFNVVIPAVEKIYLIDNRCTGSVTIKTASTAGATLPSGAFRLIYCDGATVNAPSVTGTSALGTPFTPTGGVAATNVQDAIAEVDSEKAPKASPAFTGTATFAQIIPTSIIFSGRQTLLYTDAGVDNLAIRTGAGTGPQPYKYTTFNADGGMNISNYISASGDITTYRLSTPATGALYFGNTGSKYLYYDGTNFELAGGGLKVAGRRVYGSQCFGAVTGGGGPLAVGSLTLFLTCNFTATGENAFVSASGCVNNTGPAVDVYWLFQVFNLTTGTAITQTNQSASCVGGFGRTGQASLHLAAGLVVGHSYQLRLYAQMNAATGSSVLTGELTMAGMNS